MVIAINDARHEITAANPGQYPQGNLPEVAFIGRSNVGKSSIINSLSNRRNLARVSSAPGKTQQINFYNIDDRLYLVDLPGYGYAGVSKSTKASWGGLVETYLNKRGQLKLLVLMVDIRHEPSEDDKMMYGWLVANNAKHIVTASKADKITRSRLKSRLDDIRRSLGIADDVMLIPYSSETGLGREELWKAIESVIFRPAE